VAQPESVTKKAEYAADAEEVAMGNEGMDESVCL